MSYDTLIHAYRMVRREHGAREEKAMSERVKSEAEKRMDEATRAGLALIKATDAAARAHSAEPKNYDDVRGPGGAVLCKADLLALVYPRADMALASKGAEQGSLYSALAYAMGEYSAGRATMGGWRDTIRAMLDLCGEPTLYTKVEDYAVANYPDREAWIYWTDSAEGTRADGTRWTRKPRGMLRTPRAMIEAMRVMAMRGAL